MNIIIIAPGSRGDVQPYIALGKGLQTAGHRISILTTLDFQPLISSYGLEFVSMGGSAETAAQSMDTLIEQGNLLKILASTGRGAQQMAQQAAASGLTACKGADLIVGGLGGLFVGLALSQKLGIPFLQAYLFPLTPTSAFPSVLMPLPQNRLISWTNRLSHRLTQQMIWQMFRGADHNARVKVLEMAPSSFWGPFAELQQQVPILYGYSPHVLPVPQEWGSAIHVTGYWFLEPTAEWQPPADLLHFLDSGPPPIYIGFGSMPNSKPEVTANLVLQALARTNQRGVLSAGWGGLKKEQLPATVYMAGSLPHSWLFPHMAAVVHHGGVGTTAAGLAAGIPSIVTPFFGDQPFWGQRVYDLGVGPKPIARQQLSVERLAEALDHARSDTAMQHRASMLGQQIRAEQGVARAVALIEQQAVRRA